MLEAVGAAGTRATVLFLVRYCTVVAGWGILALLFLHQQYMSTPMMTRMAMATKHMRVIAVGWPLENDPENCSREEIWSRAFRSLLKRV